MYCTWVRWVIEQTYPPSCVGVRDMPLPAVEVSQLTLLNLVVNNNIRRTNLTFWGFILKLTLRSFEGSKSSFVKWALSMFERDNSVFAGVVFTLDMHNQILRTGCHTAVTAIGNVGKYHVNDSTAYNKFVVRPYDVGLNYITMLWKWTIITYKLLQTVSIPVQPQTNPTHLCAMQQLMIRGVLLYAS